MGAVREDYSKVSPRPLRKAGLLAVAALAASSGCADRGRPASEEPALSKPPATPTAAECGADVLRTRVAADRLVPRPGTYVYAVKGHGQVSGGATGSGEGRTLPRVVHGQISRARAVGNLRCYTTFRPYHPQLIDSAVFAVRGADVHLTRLESVSGGRAVAIEPRPPIKFVDGDDLSWSGSFTGATRGTYSGRTLGVQTMKALGRTELAAGVEIRIETEGEVRGSTLTRAWIGTRSNVVLREHTRMDRSVGGPHLRVDLDLTLKGGPHG